MATTYYLGDAEAELTVVFLDARSGLPDPVTDPSLTLTEVSSDTATAIDPVDLRRVDVNSFAWPIPADFAPSTYRVDWSAVEADGDVVTATETVEIARYDDESLWISADEIAYYEGVTVTAQQLRKAQRRINREVPLWVPARRAALDAQGDYGAVIVETLRDAVMAQALWLAVLDDDPLSGQVQRLAEQDIQNYSQGAGSFSRATGAAAARPGRPVDLAPRAWEALLTLPAAQRHLIEAEGQLRGGHHGAPEGLLAYYEDPVWYGRTGARAL